MNTHPEQWAAMLQRPGSSWGFSALLKDTSVVVLRRRALVIHSLTNNPCRTRDSNPQPLDYESDSLTFRPRLPPGHNSLTSSILNLFLNKLFKIIWFNCISCISMELLCFFLNWCNKFLSFIICCLCCYCCHIVCDFNLKT